LGWFFVGPVFFLYRNDAVLLGRRGLSVGHAFLAGNKGNAYVNSLCLTGMVGWEIFFLGAGHIKMLQMFPAKKACPTLRPLRPSKTASFQSGVQ
jgi:hypothetical protein